MRQFGRIWINVDSKSARNQKKQRYEIINQNFLLRVIQHHQHERMQNYFKRYVNETSQRREQQINSILQKVSEKQNVFSSLAKNIPSPKIRNIPKRKSESLKNSPEPERQTLLILIKRVKKCETSSDQDQNSLELRQFKDSFSFSRKNQIVRYNLFSL